MSFSGRWFHPGPVELHPDVAAAMLRPMFHHRSEEARDLLRRTQPMLREMFRTTQPVMMQTAAATAMMEGAIRSGVRERVLCVIGGTFGERFADIAERCNKDVIRLRVPRGGVLEPDLLAKLLDGPPVDAITMVHSESSTGALAPIGELIPLFREMEDVVIIVDAAGSIGATAVETDAWDIDMVIAGSHKALALPPGISFAVASERFLARARDADERGRYCDAVALHQAASDHRFPQTPAVPVFHALDVQLARIAQEGVVAREARHQLMQRMVEEWMQGRTGIEFVAPSGRRSHSVSALRLTNGKRAPDITKTLDGRGFQVSTGMEADREQVIRIGHLGELQPGHLSELLTQVSELV